MHIFMKERADLIIVKYMTTLFIAIEMQGKKL